MYATYLIISNKYQRLIIIVFQPLFHEVCVMTTEDWTPLKTFTSVSAGKYLVCERCWVRRGPDRYRQRGCCMAHSFMFLFNHSCFLFPLRRLLLQFMTQSGSFRAEVKLQKLNMTSDLSNGIHLHRCHVSEKLRNKSSSGRRRSRSQSETRKVQ